MRRMYTSSHAHFSPHQTWNLEDILTYTGKPRDPSAAPPDFQHTALKTAKQLMISAATAGYTGDSQYQVK